MVHYDLSGIARDHGASMDGVLTLLRDLSRLMSQCVVEDKPVEPGEVDGWVSRLKVLNDATANYLTELDDILEMVAKQKPPTQEAS